MKKQIVMFIFYIMCSICYTQYNDFLSSKEIDKLQAPFLNPYGDNLNSRALQFDNLLDELTQNTNIHANSYSGLDSSENLNLSQANDENIISDNSKFKKALNYQELGNYFKKKPRLVDDISVGDINEAESETGIKQDQAFRFKAENTETNESENTDKIALVGYDAPPQKISYKTIITNNKNIESNLEGKINETQDSLKNQDLQTKVKLSHSAQPENMLVNRNSSTFKQPVKSIYQDNNSVSNKVNTNNSNKEKMESKKSNENPSKTSDIANRVSLVEASNHSQDKIEINIKTSINVSKKRFKKDAAQVIQALVSKTAEKLRSELLKINKEEGNLE